jgi:Bacterial Ig-like domain
VITLTSPESGSYSQDTTPTVSGRAGTKSGDDMTVSISFFSGNAASGVPVRSLQVDRDVAGQYTATLAAADALVDGTYTVQATQNDEAEHTGKSLAVTFTVNNEKPFLTFTSPKEREHTNATPTFSGSLGTRPGDIQAVTVQVFDSATLAKGDRRPLETLTANVVADRTTWTALSNALAGHHAYTAVATQTDEAGNVATLQVKFVV